MHIVFLADPVDTQHAGIHYYCVETLRAILKHERDHRITIIRTSDRGEFGAHTVAVKGSVQSVWRKFRSIPRAVRQLNPDIVVEMAHMGPFYLPDHIKRVTVIHDVTPITHTDYHRFKSRKIQQLLLPKILRKADSVITHSENTRRDLVDHFPHTEKKISVLTLGKSEIFRPTQDRAVLEKYHLARPYFLSVGTIEPRKNYEVLLKAYQQFRESSDFEVDLVIIGQKGWKNRSFYKTLKNHPFREDIHLLHSVERGELSALYSQCQAFVFPSLYEGFGLPLLEAMSCGVFCISSNVSSLPEVGGGAVCYFDPCDAATLTDLLQISFRPETANSYKEKARQRSIQFSWDIYAQDLLRVLESI